MAGNLRWPPFLGGFRYAWHLAVHLSPVRSVSQARKLGSEVKEIACIGSLRKTELGVSQGKGPGLEGGGSMTQGDKLSTLNPGRFSFLVTVMFER